MNNFFKSLILTLSALMASPALADSDDPRHTVQTQQTQNIVDKQ